jgi:hypothetical protein
VIVKPTRPSASMAGKSDDTVVLAVADGSMRDVAEIAAACENRPRSPSRAGNDHDAFAPSEKEEANA